MRISDWSSDVCSSDLIRKLYGETGAFTYDPGFTSTASCESKITYIDGDEGVLLHRGYPIGQLAEQSSFMEVAYLLLRGELPSKTELDSFIHTITRHTMVHEKLAMFYRGFRSDAHPRSEEHTSERQSLMRISYAFF